MAGLADCIVAGGAESMSHDPDGRRKSSAPTRAWRRRGRSPTLRWGSRPSWWRRNTGCRVRIRTPSPPRATQGARPPRRTQASSRTSSFRWRRKAATLVDGKLTEADRDRSTVDDGVRARHHRGGALRRLKPAFKADGTVTAGNSSQMTDGAAAVLVVSEAIPGSSMGKAPLAQVCLVRRQGRTARADGDRPGGGDPGRAQAGRADPGSDRPVRAERGLCRPVTGRACGRSGIDPARVNVERRRHRPWPSARLHRGETHRQLLHEMQRSGVAYGCVSMCIGGGMGAAGIFERI